MFFYEDILRLMKLSVLITYSRDNKLETWGEVTYWSSLGYLFYFDITSGRRITLWYSEWRWNSEKLSYRISSNKRLYNFGQRRGRLLEGCLSKGSLINLLFWFRCGWSLINYRWSGKRKCFSWYSYQLRKRGRRREWGGGGVSRGRLRVASYPAEGAS